MKEPLPAARPLIERAYFEKLDAECEFDVGTNWRAAILGGAAIAILIAVCAEFFGVLGAFIAMAAPFAVMAILDRR